MSSSPLPNPFREIRIRWLFIGFFVSSFAVGILVGNLFAISQLETTDPLFELSIYFGWFGCLCLLARQQLLVASAKPSYLIGRFPKSRELGSLFGLVAIVLLFSLGSGVWFVLFLQAIAPEYLERLQETFDRTQAIHSAFPNLYQIVRFVALVIFAPISEEFIFRGMILHRWATKWNLPAAVVVSSLLFGILHPNPIGLSAFGVVMCLLYLKTRSLWVPIIAHAANNFLAWLLLFVPESEEVAGNDLWVGCVCLAISVPILSSFIYRNFPNSQIILPYFANRHRSRPAAFSE